MWAGFKTPKYHPFLWLLLVNPVGIPIKKNNPLKNLRTSQAAGVVPVPGMLRPGTAIETWLSNWATTQTSLVERYWKPKFVQSSRSKMYQNVTPWNTVKQIPMESIWLLWDSQRIPKYDAGLLQSSEVEPPCDLEAMFVVRRLGQQKVLAFFSHPLGPCSPHGLHTEDWKMGWNVCKHSWKWAGMLRQKYGYMLLHSKVGDSGNDLFWSFCSV